MSTTVTVSSLDYWQNLSTSAIDHNASARLACDLYKYDHITPALQDRLHWLPVQQRITYKLCLLTVKGIQGVTQSYIVELCKHVNTIDSRRRLCSAAGGQLIVPRTFTDFGKRAFADASPSAWNSLRTELRLSSTNSSFCAGLKTFLFRVAYGIDTSGTVLASDADVVFNCIIHIVVKCPCAVYVSAALYNLATLHYIM